MSCAFAPPRETACASENAREIASGILPLQLLGGRQAFPS